MRTLKTGLVASALLASTVLAGCGGDEENSAEAFCTYMEENENAFDDVDVEPGTPEFDEAMQQAKDMMGEAVDKAPEEIKADVETLHGAVDQLAEVMQDVDVEADPMGAMAALEDVDLEGMEAAADRLDTWQSENCESSTE